MRNEIDYLLQRPEIYAREPGLNAPGSAFYDGVLQRLFSDQDYLTEGTVGLYKSISEAIVSGSVDTTPTEVIKDLAHSEEMMGIATSMWDSVYEGKIINFPFILAVLHSQLSVTDMTSELFERVKNFPEVNYRVETFSSIPFCSQSEGYLSDAIGTDHICSDGDLFIVKSSRADSKRGNVGYTAGVSSVPARVKSEMGEFVVVPYVWYRPASYETKDAISGQIRSDEKLSVPGSVWQVVRQFYELDFTEAYGASLRDTQNIIFDRLNQRELDNDGRGESHI